MKKHLSTIVLILIFLTGLSLLLYPTFSNWWNSLHQTRAVASYVEAMANMQDDSYKKLWEEAEAYNRQLSASGAGAHNMTEEELERYRSVLDVTGTGIMGYVEIGRINVLLPIYHGTDESVIQIAIGHVEWSSLPVGGESTHTVLSGHRGLPSARLFTDIDQLVVGDTFLLQVLDQTLTYEVDQIRIVLPYEVEELKIEPGQDYCTLITCTPYGVNTHRLLVRGHRIDTVEEHLVRVSADAIQVNTTLVALFIAVPVLVLLSLIVLLKPKKKTARRPVKLEIDDEE
ncbi:MAG: class C sortase [Lachnospiraceae bacterium]|nr:class C sortase [Lachnospiraceae bacterium]